MRASPRLWRTMCMRMLHAGPGRPTPPTPTTRSTSYRNACLHRSGTALACMARTCALPAESQCWLAGRCCPLPLPRPTPLPPRETTHLDVKQVGHVQREMLHDTPRLGVHVVELECAADALVVPRDAHPAVDDLLALDLGHEHAHLEHVAGPEFGERPRALRLVRALLLQHLHQEAHAARQLGAPLQQPRRSPWHVLRRRRRRPLRHARQQLVRPGGRPQIAEHRRWQALPLPPGGGAVRLGRRSFGWLLGERRPAGGGRARSRSRS